MFNVVLDHDSILVSSETSNTYFAKHVLIAHKTNSVFVYI